MSPIVILLIILGLIFIFASFFVSTKNDEEEKNTVIEIPEELSLAEKLKFVQKLMEADDPRAIAIFETIGAYFAYTTVLYAQFYDIDYMMLMGRVMSGKGGDTILKVCNEILAEEYPELAKKCTVTLPDEKMRRVGQSVAAASLPKMR